MKEELLFMNQSRKVLHAAIFTPMLRVLFPAFRANAEEIQICHSQLEPKQTSANYTKGGKSFPLPVEPGFEWADVFVRLKILAGMSIMPERHQSGETSVQFNGQVIPVSVEVVENEKGETVHLRLAAQQ